MRPCSIGEYILTAVFPRGTTAANDAPTLRDNLVAASGDRLADEPFGIARGVHLSVSTRGAPLTNGRKGGTVTVTIGLVGAGPRAAQAHAPTLAGSPDV